MWHTRGSHRSRQRHIPRSCRQTRTHAPAGSHGTARQQTRLHVDILAGKNAGTHTLLVLSGSSTRADVEASSIKPDHIYENLAAMMQEVTSEANVKT
ncbi:MAG: hypothetical protein E6I32_11875 [Chloroflexi bacterium]|nr:MAG: hypothetical protein E6I32_11875 [Chloroflexota bacterium]